MKIAIINATAKSGSIGKIAFGQYVRLLNDGNDVRLYYGRKDNLKSEFIVHINSKIDVIFHAFLARLTGLHGYFSNVSTIKLLKYLEKFNPDLVQLYNLHGYFININKVLHYLAKKNIPVVYSMLDEFAYLGRCCYAFDCNQFKSGCRNCMQSKTAYPKTWFFRAGRKFNRDKLKTYQALGRICYVGPQWVIKRASESNLLKGKKFYIVDEYVDTDDVFKIRTTYKFIPQLSQTDKKIILTIAPYSNPRKGGKYFLQLAQMYTERRDYIFIYIGMDIKGVELPTNCIVKGFISDQSELAEYYSVADLFVCTSLADTMPNVCLDALACGTPVLGFNITGIPYVAEEPFGKFVNACDVNMLAAEISSIEKKDSKTAEQCREYALKRYSPEIYYKNMMNIYHDMIQAGIG